MAIEQIVNDRIAAQPARPALGQQQRDAREHQPRDHIDIRSGADTWADGSPVQGLRRPRRGRRRPLVLKPAALILEGRGCFLREQFPIAPEGAFANFSLEREARMTVSCFYKWVRARTADGRSVSPYRL